MKKQPTQIKTNSNKRNTHPDRWVRILAVLFRVLIIAGLLTLVAISIGLIFSLFLGMWLLAIPSALISLGIVLARWEYHLHKRWYAQQTGDDMAEDSDPDNIKN